jgi:cellulose synthase (UDP-forming)
LLVWAVQLPSGVQTSRHDGILLGRRARWALVGVQLAVAAAYLVWRAAFTLDTAHPWYSVGFFAAEVLLALFGVGFYLTIVERGPARVAPEPPPGATVDVLIATYNEDIQLLRTTALAARDMEHPHRTFSATTAGGPRSSGSPPSSASATSQRSSNAHYKAGNLNNALARPTASSSSPSTPITCHGRSSSVRLLGHFADPLVALVQDAAVRLQRRELPACASARAEPWARGAIFHHALQPASTASTRRSSSVGRRPAAQRPRAVGGIAEGTITEDILTSMRLHAAGFRSVYVDEPPRAPAGRRYPPRPTPSSGCAGPRAP